VGDGRTVGRIEAEQVEYSRWTVGESQEEKMTVEKEKKRTKL
jgi:sRNA-binding protein